MSKRILVEPTGIMVGDVVTNFRPYDPAARPSKVKVEKVELPRGCNGIHINNSACVTAQVEVERS